MNNFTPRLSQQEILRYRGGRLGIAAVPGAGKTCMLLAKTPLTAGYMPEEFPEKAVVFENLDSKPGRIDFGSAFVKILLPFFYFIILTILFSLGFYKNQWNVVAMEDVLYRRNVSETFILGRLVKSHQDGIFSAGGLLGMGDVTEGNFNNATIQNQYRKYNKGIGFSKYWTYKSQPGVQGMVYSIVDLWTDFAPSTNLFIFRSSISIALSLVFAGICLWFLLEFGWIASISAAFYILISSKLVIFGGNLFWSLWSFYLPLPVLAFMLRKADGMGESALTFRFTATVFTLSSIKILFSGFEFITSALLLTTVPVIYYAVLKNWEYKTFLRALVMTVTGLAASVLAGLLLLGVQIRMDVGNYRDAFMHILFSWRNRTYDQEVLTSGVPDSFSVMIEKTLEVIRHNLNGYAFSLSTRFPVNSGVLRDVLDGRYLFLVILFAIATVLVLTTYAHLRKYKDNRVGPALIAACWYSALAPLSWFVIFRDHAYGHRSLGYLVLEMPFTLFGFALVGYALSALSKLGLQQFRFSK
jgi:hypothetical protein